MSFAKSPFSTGGMEQIHRRMGGQIFSFKAELKVSGDTMKGTWAMVGADGSATMELTRKKMEFRSEFYLRCNQFRRPRDGGQGKAQERRELKQIELFHGDGVVGDADKPFRPMLNNAQQL